MAARLIPAYQTFHSSNGVSPLSGGLLHFYVAGTVNTDKDTFSDKTLLTENPNPIVLDSAGRIPNTVIDVWGDGNYDLVVANSSDVEITRFDDVSGSIFVQSINTIAEMTTLLKSSLTNGDQVKVSGYFAQGDGGGGDFFFNSTSTATVNGGTVIATDEGGAGRWLRIVDGSVAIVGFGVKSDATDSSTAMGLALNAGVSLHGREGDIYFFSEVTVSSPLIIDGQGCTFKHKRNPVLQNNLNWNDWLSPFTARSTGQETMMTIASDNVVIENVTVDGNGVTFVESQSVSPPNQMVKMFAVESSTDILFDNVHISDNNGMGLFTYLSERVTFQNGSILNTRGITGAITNFEQVSIIASRYCKILHNEMGGFTPNSCIGAVGGFVDIVDGSEVGGFVPFNTDTIDSTYINFGRATGDTDTFHEICNNVFRSDIVDANEAGGGGVLGRVVTMNCGQPIIKDNIIYDTTNLSQGGIGLGHNDQPTPGEIVYARDSSRAEVAGNVIFGFRKSGQGLGILSIDAEDIDCHDNIIYNCNTAITHTRWATTSRYRNNYILFNDISFTVGDVSGSIQSHGLSGRIEITGNTCDRNLQDIVTLDQSTASAPDLIITDNLFIQDQAAAAQIQFDCFHQLLEFNRNKIVNNSTGNVADFFTIGAGRYVECSSNIVECLASSTSDLFFFDGSSGDTTGRGRLVINGLSVDCPVGGGTDNRRLNIRRLNTKECSVSNLHFTNCTITIQSKSGHVRMSDGLIETQGTTAPVSLNLNDATDAKTIFMSGFLFPAFGSTTAIITSITASAGSIVVSDCVTQENKEITDRANGDQMRNNDCWKTVVGVLTTSRP